MDCRRCMGSGEDPEFKDEYCTRCAGSGEDPFPDEWYYRPMVKVTLEQLNEALGLDGPKKPRYLEII